MDQAYLLSWEKGPSISFSYLSPKTIKSLSQINLNIIMQIFMQPFVGQLTLKLLSVSYCSGKKKGLATLSKIDLP